MQEEEIFSVSEINSSIKYLLEGAEFLQNVSIKGEISNFNAHRSGHLYFSLKDEGAQISCVMFKWMAQYLRFSPELGDKVIAKGNINVYSPRGTYQLVVSGLKQEGQGDLYAEFLKLKERLQKEGLFDQKRDIPFLPQRVGIISSPTGSVIRDIISVVQRRFPAGRLLLFPSNVQGDEAVPGLIKAIEGLNKKRDLDLIIIARGGGSMEDLWCFNNEHLARAMYNSRVPIISAIGHETDYTISDFVADRRAETPSAAAEMAFPDAGELYESLHFMLADLTRQLGSLVELFSQRLDELSARLDERILKLFAERKHRIEMLGAKLESTDIFELLEQGFSITTNDKGQRIKSINDVQIGQRIQSLITDGILESEILKRKKR